MIPGVGTAKKLRTLRLRRPGTTQLKRANRVNVHDWKIGVRGHALLFAQWFVRHSSGSLGALPSTLARHSACPKVRLSSKGRLVCTRAPKGAQLGAFGAPMGRSAA